MPARSAPQSPAMPVYTVTNGIRRVAPYYHLHKPPVKQRWCGRTAPEVLVSELGQNAQAVARGVDAHDVYLTRNNGRSGGPVPLKGPVLYSTPLAPHDAIHNRQHVHEPAITWEPETTVADWPTSTLGGAGQRPRVMACNIAVLYETADIIVACKPAGVPTHPSGTYRYNTLLEIVAHTLGATVWPCHRLDKATLGVVVLAKTKRFCAAMMDVFRLRTLLRKTYLARVMGRFLHGDCVFQCPLISANSSGAGYLNVPAHVSTESCTQFRCVAYLDNSNESIIECRPMSGKMHQIRIHLALLGHPITNDAYYNGTDALSRAKNDIERMLYAGVFSDFPGFARPRRIGEDVESYPLLILLLTYVTEEIQTKLKALAFCRKTRDLGLVTGRCGECLLPLYAETSDHGIYLHALSLEWLQNAPVPDLHTGIVFAFSFVSGCPIWYPADSRSSPSVDLL